MAVEDKRPRVIPELEVDLHLAVGPEDHGVLLGDAILFQYEGARTRPVPTQDAVEFDVDGVPPSPGAVLQVPDLRPVDGRLRHRRVEVDQLPIDYPGAVAALKHELPASGLAKFPTGDRSEVPQRHAGLNVLAFIRNLSANPELHQADAGSDSLRLFKRALGPAALILYQAVLEVELLALREQTEIDDHVKAQRRGNQQTVDGYRVVQQPAFGGNDRPREMLARRVRQE